ncbi:DUF6371 domain-containing protein [Formosa haliotis]|uniref:DUF6371 domain-containing protein n=1 Tax=Formosa haliotis TaxID=1555194 RepID=UPI000826A768|nr:DUF6371 domain-containing protein [Formosa haliotis]
MYKYTLHKKSIKHICPNCGKKRFVKYIDNDTGDYLSSEVGRCDREQNCAYHYPPKQYFSDKKIDAVSYVKTPTIKPEIKFNIIPSFHNQEAILKSQNHFDKNNFVQFLYSNFEQHKVFNMLKTYCIGTAQNNYFGTVFWQIDNLQKIHAGKIINYDKQGHRTKYINWVHAIELKQKTIKHFNLNQCLFGLHLLNNSNKIIAIVESEKTACIMSLIFDKYLWMATGSLKGLNAIKLKPLKERPIILYPDLGREGPNGSPFTQWTNKAKELRLLGFDVQTSDLLEANATANQRLKGLDIADYFITSLDSKPIRIFSTQAELVNKLCTKNESLITLINVFELCDEDGNKIEIEK